MPNCKNMNNISHLQHPSQKKKKKKKITTLRLCLALCKTFFKYKIFSSEFFFWKRKYFQVFGGTQKNALKNTFSTSYSHFLNFQTNM